jgi:hypothetical protein
MKKALSVAQPPPKCAFLTANLASIVHTNKHFCGINQNFKRFYFEFQWISTIFARIIIKNQFCSMSFTKNCNLIFNQAIRDYHFKNDVDTPINNPYERDSIENRLYLKCWIDTVQWHLEDIIRDPHIDPLDALALKRRIDRSNQDRTDLVEQIDSYFQQTYSDVNVLSDARINTESPAWAVDRLSILALKIYHMQEQVSRTDASKEHKEKCQNKLNVLLEQQKDLGTAIDQLLEDIEAGRKYMKVYRQMKMYNDPSTNPILYGKK